MKRVLVTLLLLSFNSIGQEDIIKTESKTESTVNSTSSTTLNSPPPSAIIPTMNNSNSDLCTVGIAGAVQTQILGLSAGKTVRDMNCERLKLSKTLFDMGMKVAAVSTMCQDKRVFDAMMNAGTPCPKDGLIGPEAKLAWDADESAKPSETEDDKREDDTLLASGGILLLLLLLL
jgi:hypothetical protein